ncbi:hypothetical protein VUR80DRAFT_4775 [Thermomyces stellatus]
MRSGPDTALFFRVRSRVEIDLGPGAVRGASSGDERGKSGGGGGTRGGRMRGQMTAATALGPAHPTAGRGHEEAVKGASAAIQPQPEWRANQGCQGSIVQLQERGAWPAAEREGGRRSRPGEGPGHFRRGANHQRGRLLLHRDGFALCPAASGCAPSAPSGPLSASGS